MLAAPDKMVEHSLPSFKGESPAGEGGASLLVRWNWIALSACRCPKLRMRAVWTSSVS